MKTTQTLAKPARIPGTTQGLVLASLAWVAAIAAVVLGPVLPTMAQVFKDVPGVDIKIPLVATGPSLLVALLSIPYGALADRIGRRRLLLTALLFYGVAGMAPLLLGSLDAIVVSRLLVGLAEAAVMTCGTALIGDYFHGRERERWLAVQAGLAPVAAIATVALGGALGALGWRMPFYVYAWGWILIPLVWFFLWEPRIEAPVAKPAAATHEPVVAFSWKKPIWIAIALMLSMIGFMVTVVQFGFLATERGMTDPGLIGLYSALVTVGNPVGSIAFGVLRARIITKLALAYALFTIGFLIMSLIPTMPAAIIGGFIANMGAGLMLPSLLTWMLATMPAAVRGQGSGLFTTGNFLGQFLGPLTVLVLIKTTGNLSDAILVLGIASACACFAALWHVIRNNSVVIDA